MKSKKDNGLVYARTERQENMMRYVGIWAGYYRANPHRWVSDFLHISLKLFQIILLNMMNTCSTFVLIAARGIGKTYIGAVFCIFRCVLYPGEFVPSLAVTQELTPIELLERPESGISYNIRMRYALV